MEDPKMEKNSENKNNVKTCKKTTGQQSFGEGVDPQIRGTE